MRDANPPPDAPASEVRPIDERHVRAVRLGHGANCSSIGSVVDTLFATGTIGVVVFAMIAAALRAEPVAVVGRAKGGRSSAGGPPPPDPPPAED